LPYQYGYQGGIEFVERFAERYQAYPSSSAASTYSVLFQYKAAVERAQSFDSEAVIRALEGHQYSMLKDPQEWRAFDHQNVQSVQVVRVNNRDVALQDQFNEDFFEILMSIPGARGNAVPAITASGRQTPQPDQPSVYTK
jgi:ABC-type branched-subunit amino acid transport system substrate-binding protein